MSLARAALSLLALVLLAGPAAAASASPSCEHNITFFSPWAGGNAWLVNYTGPFFNDRPPHVQVGSSQVKNVRFPLYRHKLRAVARPTGSQSPSHTHPFSFSAAAAHQGRVLVPRKLPRCHLLCH